MKTMPKSIEIKIRRLNKLNVMAAKLDGDIQDHLETAGVPYDNLVATPETWEAKEPVTEGLAFINNAECVTDESLNETINEIREVYEYFINK